MIKTVTDELEEEKEAKEEKFEEILSNGIDGTSWKPKYIGTQIEGTFIGFKKGTKDPIPILKTCHGHELALPPNPGLKNKMMNIYRGEYVRITLQNIEKEHIKITTPTGTVPNDSTWNIKHIYTVEIEK